MKGSSTESDEKSKFVRHKTFLYRPCLTTNQPYALRAFVRSSSDCRIVIEKMAAQSDTVPCYASFDIYFSHFMNIVAPGLLRSGHQVMSNGPT